MSIKAMTASGPKDDRQKDDFYPTPPEATEALLGVEKFKGSIWEPACGDGAISKILVERGHDVYSSDLVNRGYGQDRYDFLMHCDRRADNIITNPPFKLALPFAQRALDVTTDKVAFLLRLAWLESISRKDFFEQSPLSRVWVFSWRIPFRRSGHEGKGANAVPYAWFVWQHGYEDDPKVGWL